MRRWLQFVASGSLMLVSCAAWADTVGCTAGLIDGDSDPNHAFGTGSIIEQIGVYITCQANKALIFAWPVFFGIVACLIGAYFLRRIVKQGK